MDSALPKDRQHVHVIQHYVSRNWPSSWHILDAHVTRKEGREDGKKKKGKKEGREEGRVERRERGRKEGKGEGGRKKIRREGGWKEADF